ncbi:MAG TPA: Rne/Rng family ribonuclease [Acidothermaceae bacterium]|jgi:ribonuclease E|nr:Rne/Rng family ribonuclease [Acidothermaceae bacterium]
MLENEPTNSSDNSGPGESAGPVTPRRKRAAVKKATKKTPAVKPVLASTPVKGRRPAKKTAAAPVSTHEEPQAAAPEVPAAKKAAAKRAPRKAAKTAAEQHAPEAADAPSRPAPVPTLLFQPPSAENAVPASAARRSGQRRPSAAAEVETADAGAAPSADETPTSAGAGDGTGAPRRRRRGGRGRRGGSGGSGGQGAHAESEGGADHDDAGDGRPRSAGSASDDGTHDDDHDGEHRTDGGDRDHHDPDGEGSASSRRRRRRRSRGAGEVEVRSPDDPPNTVVRIRPPREHDDDASGNGGVQGVKGSTRLEAKKQRRREGREQGRHGRRGLVITESEFLARRESVDRVMAVRQRGDRTQIGVLEDGILVEHYVSTASTNRMVGNVYLGRVQNVLSGMEAAFIDIGKGRNAVLYAGEVNFDTSGIEGGPRRIESALKPGQAVVVQVTKDPIGQKGARLTSQVSLPGRYLVYVPEGSMMGISRKLPDVERSRLKAILKKVTPEGAGVIVRTAAEGASEEDLTRDVARLAAQWEVIQKKSETATAPALLYSEPDLTIRVIRDVFNEDFNQLIVSADSDWETVEAYVTHVAPDLLPRLSQWTSEEDIFTHYRVDEQIVKALDRKVWLPSGGYLVIDRTEAMIVIDVNTGRFIGKGGNLEETVTKNNLEAAEEIVRQLRLRDIGGIIVIDFIDMVLEGNRDLVLRRLVECLGRDRTKHQVAEVTSLGLVQMTRKRVGNGLLEAFSEICEVCNGRGVIVHTDLVDHNHSQQRALPASRPTPAVVARATRSRGRGASAEAAAVEGDAPVVEAALEGDAVAAQADGAQAGSAQASEGAHASEGAEQTDGGAPAKTTSGASRSRRGGRRRGGSKANAGADHTAAQHDSAPSDLNS